MDTPTQGATPPAAEPGQPGQQQPQQPQATPGAATPPTQPAQASPSAEELGRQLAELKEQNRIATESARHWQSQADRERQRTQALAGVTPQADPLAEDIKFFTAQGYEEKDARMLVEFTNRKVAGLTQQNQSLQQSMQASSAIGGIIQQAANDKDYAPLFADPEIANAVHQEMQRCALSGQANMVTPDYAKAVAEGAYASLRRPWLQNPGTTQQATQQQPMGFLPFNGPMPGYSPAGLQQQAPQRPPGAEIHDREIAERFGIKP